MAELSVIVPARNDAETLPRAIRDLDRVIAQASIFSEVLVIDDASEDGTLETAQRLAEEYPNLHMRICQRSDVKKAIVTLAEGETIDVTTGL